MPLRVLALEPYYGGSHRALLDDWISRSDHTWTLLTLPAYKWRWRMRHAPLTFSEEVNQRLAAGQRWDVLFCSDMLSLPDFLGFTPGLAGIPAVVYFHENQLTYPVQTQDARDGHYGFTNILTAIAADETWFNSAFHREEFQAAATSFLKRMPDFSPLTQWEACCHRTRVMFPGVTDISPPRERRPGPLHILWAARWEYDKNPADFFRALDLLQDRGVDFRLSVVGESFRNTPPDFAAARERFGKQIVHWGFQPSREDYLHVLQEADVAVSTANHEFFGISIVEAVSAGAVPLVPRRLAYPETLEISGDADPWFYDGSPEQLAGRLESFANSPHTLQQQHGARMRRVAAKYPWQRLAAGYDNALTGVVTSKST